MKRKLSWLEGAALSLTAAWSVVGCLATAFRLQVVLNERAVLLWCAVCLGSMLLFSTRKGGFLLLLLTGLGIAAALRFLPLWAQTRNLLGSIAQTYDLAYGWGIPKLLRDARGDSTLPALLLGVLVIESVVCAVFRRRGTPLASALLILPLAVCLVVTDTVPDPICLFPLLGCLCLLLLTESVRAEGAWQGSRLTLAAALPVVLALGLLFHFAPQDTYHDGTEPLRRELLSYAEELVQRVQDGQLGLPNYERRSSVSLANLPSQPMLGLPVAEVAAEVSGPAYLRVQDYDIYTGTSWVSSPNRQETLSGTGEATGVVVIRDLVGQPGILLPSYPAGSTVLENGIAVNEAEEKVYRFSCVSSAMAATPSENTLKLPEGTRTDARALVQHIAADASGVEATANAIAAFVRNSAAYSRTVQPMSAGAGDFALWFLDSAERGYCVHFATAAAVLLRSAGIPARYVTGYRANAVAGQTLHVTSDDAHAWVEYYNYKTWSWSILEATPADLELTPVETDSVSETRPAPTETTPTTAATEPETTLSPSQPEPQKAFPRWLPLTVLGIILAGCMLQLQRFARIHLRQRRQRRGSSNRRAIARWEELLLLHRLLGSEIPEELEVLAEKAMFSQYTLTREEGNVFLEDARACRAQLHTKPLHKRLLYRYWFAVI